MHCRVVLPRPFCFTKSLNDKHLNNNNNSNNNNNDNNINNNNNNNRNNNNNIIKSLFNEFLYLPNALTSEASVQMIVTNINRFHANVPFLHLENRDFLMCSGGVEMEHCREIG